MRRRKAEFIGSAFFVFDHYRLQSSIKSQITKVKEEAIFRIDLPDHSE